MSSADQWFQVGDSDRAASEASNSAKKKLPTFRRATTISIFSGCGDEVVAQVAEQVLRRCRFLLSLSPATPRPAEATGAKKMWNRLGMLAHSGSNGGSPVKSPTLLRSASAFGGSSSGGKFADLVRGASSASSLRQMLDYKRFLVTKQSATGSAVTAMDQVSACQAPHPLPFFPAHSSRRGSADPRCLARRPRSPHVPQLVHFVREDVPVDEMSELLSLRGRRAARRALGFRAAVEAMAFASSDSTLGAVLAAVSGVRACVRAPLCDVLWPAARRPGVA